MCDLAYISFFYFFSNSLQSGICSFHYTESTPLNKGHQGAKVPRAFFQSSTSLTFLQHLIMLTTVIPFDSLFSFRAQNTTLSWFSFYLSDCPFTNSFFGYTSSISTSHLFLSPFCFVSSLYALHGQLYPLPHLQWTFKFWIKWWFPYLNL